MGSDFQRRRCHTGPDPVSMLIDFSWCGSRLKGRDDILQIVNK
jgi:hypothetical protein